MQENINTEDGERLSLLAFEDSVRYGNIVDNDGIGYFSDINGTPQCDFPVVPSEFNLNEIPTGMHYVIWYNK